MEDFENRKIANSFFPSMFSIYITNIMIKKFQSYINRILTNTKYIYENWNLFILSRNFECNSILILH